jgi:molybdopterin synthase catalytic subunit
MNRSGLASHGSVLIDVTDQPLDFSAVVAFVQDPAAGAVVVFSGTVRDHSEGREGVTHLEYEAYEGVVVEKIAAIVNGARSRWPILKVAAVHRTGSLVVGDPAVVVAVSTPHRADAFPACRFVIDELKRSVPIWKKEHWAGGAEWVREDLHHAGEGGSH